MLREGIDFFKAAKKNKIEGIIGKKNSSTYQSIRSQEWVKLKTVLRQEVVIGGFTEPKGSRKYLGALLVGVYDAQGQLNYTGHVGGGFDGQLLEQVYRKLEPLIQLKSPFKEQPIPNAAVTWVKPRLIAEVSFAEWTKDNIMRQPIFQGMRTDKPAQHVIREVPQDISPALQKPKAKNSNKLPPSQLALTHLDKIYWAKEGYTKGDLIAYYQNIAPYILPYLKDRPVMLHRYPNGIEGPDFYQKDIGMSHPACIKVWPVQHSGKKDNYILIQDLPSLLYAINLGSIDLHPFISRYKNLERPDYCILDFDPHGVSFEKTVQAVLVAHEILQEIKVVHYCKTSGGKGLHILIPLHAKYTFEQSRQFAEIISSLVHARLPKTTSLERAPQKRLRKIYLDCLQNRFGQTIVAPYAVRPLPHALVSTPLEWSEVTEKLDPTNFNLQTIPQRLSTLGDIFKPVLSAHVNIKTALAKLKKVYAAAQS